MNDSQRVQLKLDLLEELGHPLSESDRILDFGCGNGAKVVEFRERGFDCYGCDLRHARGLDAERLRRQQTLRVIERPYRLPFDDQFFSFVFSDQVLEHVRDHRLAFREIARVLQPGGVCLHVFPAKYVPIEPHVLVPMASWYRPFWWIHLWAALGIRRSWQRGKRAREIALSNYRYLETKTKYLTKAELRKLSDEYFDEHRFCTRSAVRKHPRINQLGRTLCGLPGVGWALDSFVTHVLLQVKSASPVNTRRRPLAAEGVQSC